MQRELKKYLETHAEPAEKKSGKKAATAVNGHPALRNTTELTAKTRAALDAIRKAAEKKYHRPIVSRKEFILLRSEVTDLNNGPSQITKNLVFQLFAKPDVNLYGIKVPGAFALNALDGHAAVIREAKAYMKASSKKATKNSIKEVESRLEEDLSKLRSPEYKSLETMKGCLAPPGYRVHVQLLGKDGRKKSKNASADSWTPECGEIRIHFEPDAYAPAVYAAETPAVSEKPPSDPVADFVRSLDRAESKPGYDFIALKWFRDVFLQAEKFEWAASDSARQDALRDAIERRLVLVSRVPNPKSPQFPVTAIRLNRLLPDVRAMLGTGSVPDSGFDPVDIRGEKLSATVLRERR